MTKHVPLSTLRGYTTLDKAYAELNATLFEGSLPPCIITLQRHSKAYGYYSGERFVAAHGKTAGHVDEIAMNPMHFANRTPEEILSTLLHEMVHQWQHHQGKKPTRCYHDRQWAAQMKVVGLYPSNTGKPGGKETGPQMTHYIIEGGPFAKWCTKFLKANKAELYQDRAAILRAAGKGGKGGEGEGEGDDEGKAKTPGRIKFTCKGCELNAWAKPTAKLRCEDCDRPLRAEEKEGDAD